MNKTVAVMGTLDTKAQECRYISDKIASLGCAVVTIDVSGSTIPTASRSEALTLIKQRATKQVHALLDAHQIDGIISLGGSGGTDIAGAVMRTLPLGFPKVLISTLGSSPSIAGHVGGHDILVLNSVADIAGINSITKAIFDQGAGAVVGAVNAISMTDSAHSKPKIAATMYGLTTPCVTVATEYLQAHGYEVITFHANGSEGRILEHLLAVDYFQGVLDVTTTEVSAEVLGGDDTAGKERLKTAMTKNIPCVVCPGAMDLVYTASPERYADHALYAHNDKPSHFRPNVSDNQAVGAYVAQQLNHANGRCALMIPCLGLSGVGVEGGVLYDPIADKALFDSIEASLDQTKVSLSYHDLAINDPAFGLLIAKQLHQLLQPSHS